MSEDNVEIVRRAFEAFNDPDVDAMLANWSEDVELRLIGGLADLMGGEFKVTRGYGVGSTTGSVAWACAPRSSRSSTSTTVSS